MEDVKAFLASGYGSGSGYGDGSGYGYGYGDGYGDGDGYGSGSGYGYGYGSGYGDGSGYGYGYGDGDGYGSGSGDGDGLKTINNQAIYIIDDTPTIIYSIHGGIARCATLHEDLTLSPCYIVKENDIFAHGSTIHEAVEALQEKLFEDMPEEERIEAFLNEHKENIAYPNKDFFEWHHKLTGSCLFGRQNFAKEHSIDVETGYMTVSDFINLTKDAYGGDIIQKLAEEMQK